MHHYSIYLPLISEKIRIKRTTTTSEFVFKTINQSLNFIKDIKIFNNFFQLYQKI